MTNIIRKIWGFLPTKMRAAIKPIHRGINKQFKPSGSDSLYEMGIISLEGFEVAYRKGTADEKVIQQCFGRDIFFSGVPEYQVADDHVIIDVGAHIGTFSILASSKVQRGKVYAIEASEDSYNFLRVNCALNRATNVFAHHLALSDRRGTCRLYYAQDIGNWGHSTVYPLSSFGETVECCTLADFMENNRIEKCHYLKLNCEGAEFPILLNTPSTVLQRFITILVHYHCDLWRSNTETDLLSYFQSCGFNTTIRNRSENRGWIIATNTG